MASTKGLTTAEQARTRCKTFDRAHLDYLNRMSRFILGDGDWAQTRLSGATDGDNGFPIYTTEANHVRKVGQSRRMLNSIKLQASKFLAQEPAPRFDGVKPLLGEMRKAFFLRRYRGKGTADGGWAREIESAFLDGCGLGFGAVVFGGRRNPTTDQQFVDAEYVPATQVVWDPLEPSLGRSSWALIVRYVSRSEAEARWGEEAVKESVRYLFDVAGSKRTEYVRVSEYFDLGYGNGYDDSKPTHIIWLGSWDSDPAYRGPNLFKTLPIAHYEGITPPGRRRPIGAADEQLAVTTAINQLEGHLLKIAKRAGIDLIDVNAVDKQDLERYARGQEIPFIRVTTPDPQGKPVVNRIPAQEVGQTLLQLMSLYDRQFNADSISSDADRGSTTETKRTASEIMQLAAGTQQAGGSTRKAVLHFYRRVVEKALAVSAAIDTDPCKVDVMGTVVPINDPDKPALAIARLLEDPSEILITPQSLEGTDTITEMQTAVAKLNELFPLVQMGLVPARWFAEEKLRAVGYSEPDEILGDPQANQAPQPGMPGAMPPGAPGAMPPGAPGTPPMGGMPPPGMAPAGAPMGPAAPPF